MDNLPGAFGTAGSLVLRMIQASCSVTGLFYMCSIAGFYEYVSFSLLATVMLFVIPWSVILTVADCYFVYIRPPTRRVRIILLVAILDWIFAMMSLAGSCATASSAEFLYPDENSGHTTSWSPRHISASAAFMCFMAMCGNALFNLWIIPRIQ